MLSLIDHGEVFLRSDNNYLKPFNELRQPGQGEDESYMEREMSKGPDLLSQGSKMFMVEAIKIQHVQYVLCVAYQLCGSRKKCGLTYNYCDRSDNKPNSGGRPMTVDFNNLE